MAKLVGENILIMHAQKQRFLTKCDSLNKHGNNFNQEVMLYNY